jgi:hypothetical protein
MISFRIFAQFIFYVATNHVTIPFYGNKDIYE